MARLLRLSRVGRRRLLQALALAALPPSVQVKAQAQGLQFPRDFGAHPAQRLEWWYLTGVLREAAQESPRFGYQLTFFRVRGPAPAEHPSRFAAKHLLLAHAALSDLKAGQLRHDQRLARAGMGVAEASETDCDVHLRDWFLRREGPGYRAGCNSHGSNNLAGFALDLHLKTTQAPLLQGRQGLSRKGPQPAQFSHYYSQVQLHTAGSLRLGAARFELSGRSWLDHEWSDDLLGASGAADSAVGWDWAGINLADGGALTVFRLRRADGTQLWAGGSWRRADGATQDFAPEQVQMSPLRVWCSPASGGNYPVEWRVSTPQGEVRLRALLDAQEIDARASTGMRYWEGASELLTSGGQRLGLGYLELTGYVGGMQMLQSAK
ncbi:MAG: carotenoid 1,2-hydratase [Paucibacter sp.]|nr:carotenoid 1,2-hydratase [Roseateles sp.]